MRASSSARCCGPRSGHERRSPSRLQGGLVDVAMARGHRRRGAPPRGPREDLPALSGRTGPIPCASSTDGGSRPARPRCDAPADPTTQSVPRSCGRRGRGRGVRYGRRGRLPAGSGRVITGRGRSGAVEGIGVSDRGRFREPDGHRRGLHFERTTHILPLRAPAARRGVAPTGRAPVSKTGSCGFESRHPCNPGGM